MTKNHQRTTAAVAVGTTDTVATYYFAPKKTRLVLSVKNAGAAALDAFVTQMAGGGVTDMGDWTTLFSTTGDYTVPKHPLVMATGDPMTLAAAGIVVLIFDISGLPALRFQASANAAVTTLQFDATIEET
jgi:hypothetical protein